MASQGERFRQALRVEAPLQIVGVINAYIAIMAQQTGFRALYLSGAGVANSAFGLPDLGMTSLDNVAEEARRIVAAVDTPLLVDIDTGWGNSLMIARTIKTMEAAGVAAIHLEDQLHFKRCGHREGKRIATKEVMIDRIKAAVDARKDSSFVIMARSDAFASEGLNGLIERCQSYIEAGADMLFLEALPEITDYNSCHKKLDVPLLANLTEFGKTPLFSLQELTHAGVQMALYPLSANRAMNFAALAVLETVRKEGSQRSQLDKMQSRDQLYKFLNYEAYEKALESNGCH